MIEGKVITIITDRATGESKKCIVIYNNLMANYTIDDLPTHMIIEGNEYSVEQYLESIKDRILIKDWEKVDSKMDKDIPVTDSVHHPNHYTSGDVECIDAIRASMTPDQFAGYCKGNCIKYIWRFEHKNQTEDIQKAQVYLTWLLNTLKGEPLTK